MISFTIKDNSVIIELSLYGGFIMLLRQIKYFQAVVEKGSFTEAAETCYISQSAISQHIQSLEKKIGVKLFERKNRKFTLTPAREHFYQKTVVLSPSQAPIETISRVDLFGTSVLLE